MVTRREFLIGATLFSGAKFSHGLLNPIEKAMAIEPSPGSSYLDAEHVVILMQENRSFDHMFGTLRGVRGFNDPRAITLPDGNPVWLQHKNNFHQKDDFGPIDNEGYIPFHLNMKDSMATWMGSLPHSWTNQVDAHNYG